MTADTPEQPARPSADMRTTVSDTALVFEGGGMRASLTSAVVAGLIEEGIFCDFVSGISAGSSNTANYLARDARRARACFVDFADDPRFGSWRTWIRGQGLFAAEYIYQHAGRPGQALPYDFGAFQANPTRFAIGGFDAETGETAWWGREDVHTLDDLMVRVRASSTMPVLMPPVKFAGTTWVDGALGVDGGIPLTPGEQAGYEKQLVILTRERSYVKRPERFPGFYRTYFRRYPAVAEGLTTRWKRYNETRERLFEMERAGTAYVFAPEHMPVQNGERNVAKLAAAHELGRKQFARELPAIREFLGLDG